LNRLTIYLTDNTHTMVLGNEQKIVEITVAAFNSAIEEFFKET
jgi:hypothetical protein